jgi:hypothetical protein
MKHIKFLLQAVICNRKKVKWAFVALMISALGCSKSNPPGYSGSPSGGTTGGGTTTGSGSNPLLSKEVLVAKNAAAADEDSIVTLFTYDGNKNLTQTEQTTFSNIAGASLTISITYHFTYSNKLISGFTGTVDQTYLDAGQTFSSNSQISSVFHASGSRIDYYVQSVSTSGSAPLPVTLETGNDSATLTYDASGNLSTLNIYQLSQGSSEYQQISQQNFTYSNGNLSKSINVESVSGIVTNTVTSLFQYDSKISAAPIFIVPGVPVNSTNDLSSSTQTTTGLNAQTISTTYQTNYNSTNQPVNSLAALTITPQNPENIATETITYTY